MKNYLVCYDIADDDQREQVSVILGRYGERVQRSVFEVMLRTDADLEELRRLLTEALGNTPEVRLYRLCEHCRRESFTLVGERIAVFPSTIIV